MLVGDAKATAHFSIGSGTKLAMEDAIALYECAANRGRRKGGPARLRHARREDVEKTQHAANVSLAWFENMRRYWDMDPLQFAFGVMSRSKQITCENLRAARPGVRGGGRRWFAGKSTRPGIRCRSAQPAAADVHAVQAARHALENRVVVSPMDQYSAVDGMPSDWHLVHLGSRAVGGAGLVFVEMTCTSPEARISPGCTGLWNEAQRDAFQPHRRFLPREVGGEARLQLGHSGRKGSTQLGWERMDHPLDAGNWPLVSPSPIPYYEGFRRFRAK